MLDLIFYKNTNLGKLVKISIFFVLALGINLFFAKFGNFAFGEVLQSAKNTHSKNSTKQSASAIGLLNYWQTSSKFPFDKPLAGLNDEEQDQMVIGRSFFVIPWVEAPSATTARDGLGPLFNSNTCTGCHFKRSSKDVLTKDGNVSKHIIFKLGRPDEFNKDKSLLLQDDNYGTQIANHGTKNHKFEATPKLKIKYKTKVLPDKTKVELRYFEPYLTNLNYGKLNANSKISPRLAIVLVGLGLVAKIPKEMILEYEDPTDADGDGISGRANWVINPETGKKEMGKYGYKASQSTVTMQSADAAFNDMSLTNPLFPKDNCAKNQTECQNAVKGLRTDEGGELELPLSRLKGISFYLQHLKAPPPYDKRHSGFKVFAKTGCISCHRADYKVSKNLEVNPFTDFLLHDMGKNLEDSRYEWEATPAQWRTAPLWGLSAKLKAGIPLLHDGRARNPLEAILWHGGEAEQTKQKFMNLDKKDRNLLLSFLETL